MSILPILLHTIFPVFSVYLFAFAVPLFPGACLLSMYLLDNKISPWPLSCLGLCLSVCMFFHIG